MRASSVSDGVGVGVRNSVYFLPHPHLTAREAALANESVRAHTWPLLGVPAAADGKGDNWVPVPLGVKLRSGSTLLAGPKKPR